MPDASRPDVELPVQATRHKRTFQISARFDMADAFASLPSRSVSLRLALRATMANWSWANDLTRPAALVPAYELSFDAEDKVLLRRGGRADEDPERVDAT
ncbi:MAG: hypothetical protein QM655_15110 [Nocardioidaceae bacterium]